MKYGLKLFLFFLLVQQFKGHGGGTKSTQVTFLKNGMIFTTGFSKMSEREYALWDAQKGIFKVFMPIQSKSEIKRKPSKFNKIKDWIAIVRSDRWRRTQCEKVRRSNLFFCAMKPLRPFSSLLSGDGSHRSKQRRSFSLLRRRHGNDLSNRKGMEVFLLKM